MILKAENVDASVLVDTRQVLTIATEVERNDAVSSIYNGKIESVNEDSYCLASDVIVI